MIRFGSARSNEFGGISGGIPGDQTTHECEWQDWYLHEKGWVVIRAKSEAAREKIAQDMEYICENQNIGYDQPRDQSLYKASKPFGFNASMVKTPCDTDCARAVRVCVLYAGIDCPDFYTATEISALQSTGAFDVLRDDAHCKDWRLLKRGDILCTPTQGHTGVILDDGPGDVPMIGEYRATGNLYLRTGPGTEYPSIGVIKKGDTMQVQIALTSWAYGVAIGKTGYASMKYLEPVTSTILKATGSLNLRTGAGVLNRSIGVIRPGQTVVATGEQKNVLGRIWYQIKADGKTGWASSKYLSEVRT